MNSVAKSTISIEPCFYASLAIGCVVTLLAQIYYVGWLAQDGSRLISTLGMILGSPLIYMPWLAAYKINSIRHISPYLSGSFNIIAAGFGMFGFLELLDVNVDHSLSAFAFVVIPTYQAIVMVVFYLVTLRNDKKQATGNGQGTCD